MSCQEGNCKTFRLAARSLQARSALGQGVTTQGGWRGRRWRDTSGGLTLGGNAGSWQIVAKAIAPGQQGAFWHLCVMALGEPAVGWRKKVERLERCGRCRGVLCNDGPTAFHRRH